MDERGEASDTGWARWGTAQAARELPDGARKLLAQVLDLTPPPPAVPLAEVALPDCELDEVVLDALRHAVGDEHVVTAAPARARRASGMSTPDLLRDRLGRPTLAPQAVIRPADHAEVVAVLDVCSARGVPVVPFGGGTSVVGGLTPAAARHVTVDLCRLDDVVSVDPVSRTATLQAGLPAPRAAQLLAAHGLTLGHVPQSYEYATIGGFAATRSSGQASAGYGRFDDMVTALTVATPRGTVRIGRAPASAAGPDLRQLFLGSEGTLGIITDVTVRVRPLPAQSHHEGWRFESFAAGLDAVRRLAQDGPRPTVLRLSDEIETMIGAAGSGRSDGGCLLIAGYEGADVHPTAEAAAGVLAAHGGVPLGAEAGQQWVRHRFDAPYLRDALLEAGAFAETLETAAYWSTLPQVYQRVRAALLDALPDGALVLGHVSHVYETGASLYFTVICSPGPDPIGRWHTAKAAAGDAIIAAGATITHHHGVGADHRQWYATEIGDVAVDLLRTVKRHLDPAGILNPGILVP
ncbi:FAD-binding oxidoreductase [Micromonospora endolithica]|uniref:FAD-binding oxidoreductase n=1 Tax=Micromonospora endolithica TaxID=230091 RepID=A0A3A9ZK16_9ACTN|nr:FAD-binding oxidoreductase [Micromonospora endolithica]RKN47656.1 FAD-binding oxidoreductase [Micromonospora endolithica]TWJ21324.1 alkyldihydroxyacetonephosphate synthase [Micromonospora endolithica]